MNLKSSRFLFLDCQTTGMRPPAGQLLELAWSFTSAASEATPHSRLLALPEGEEVPDKIRELTGIGPDEMKAAVSFESLLKELSALLQGAAEPVTAIIHYAQFEKPFLADLFARSGQATLPFEILCSHQITKKLFPNLPSQNIRGAAGFFGIPPTALKRASSHVVATHQIWRGIVEEAEKQGISTIKDLRQWLLLAPKKKVSRYEYRIDKLKRLELPNSPGIYRMLSKSGEILYVGKATSLKSRVNSYFRGKKGRDQRKLEMLAQVWDLKVTECKTPLEAAILESDEIKRLNPPYNVVLKRGQKHLLFYNHDFSSSSQQQSAEYPIGPFRGSNWIEHLRLLFQSLSQSEFEQIFFNPISPENLRLGFELFCQGSGLELKQIKSVRSLLARGMWILKNYVEPEEEAPEVEEDDAETEEQELTIEEIAGKFERLLRRSAAEYLRAKSLTRLLNARIVLTTRNGEMPLQFSCGVLNGSSPRARCLPWQTLAIDDFERMSILLSELKKYDFTIQY